MSLTVELWRKARIAYGDQPNAPAQPTASNIGANGVRIDWEPVPAADSYILQQAPSGGSTWTTLFAGFGVGYDVTGLTTATAYDFRVAALDGTAQSEWSPIRTVTTSGTLVTPSVPSTPTASNVSSTTATLTTTPAANATSYGWQRSATSGTTGFAVIPLTGLTINDSGLTPVTDYWYRVRGSNADGNSAYSTAVQITTIAAPIVVPAKPAAPPFTTGATPTMISLGWGAVAGTESYTVQRSLTGAIPWANVYIGPNLAVDDTGRTAGTTYFYRYAAGNTAGQGPQSEQLQTTTPTTGPNVQPVSALRIVSRSGICAHPNFNTAGNVWQVANADDFISRVASVGASHIRGALPADATAAPWAAACRTHGVKWLMTVVPEGSPNGVTNQTVAETVTKIRRINDNYADIVAGIEGPNEPNHNRDNTPIQLDWAQVAFNHQEAIWNTAKEPGSAISNVKIVGPSLHDVAADNSYTQGGPDGGPQHFHQLLDIGILTVQNMCGLHTYPGGSYPLRKLDERLARMWSAYGTNYPAWCTEHGWHNALNTIAGHKPISEAGAGVYGPRAILQFTSTVKPNGLVRDLYYTYFEGLDDVDTALIDHEKHFGMWGVGSISPSTWRAKPIVGTVGAMLNAMADPPGQATYTPPLVVCDVSSPSGGANLQWQVVATKAQADAGTATCWVYRDMEVWNRDTATAITVPAVAVDIRDRVGIRRINVDANVTRLDLR